MRATALISTDRARTYKPDPWTYTLAETCFGLPRRQIAFAALGGGGTLVRISDVLGQPSVAT